MHEFNALRILFEADKIVSASVKQVYFECVAAARAVDCCSHTTVHCYNCFCPFGLRVLQVCLSVNVIDSCFELKLFLPHIFVTETELAVLWVVVPCSVVGVYQHFRGPYCLRLQGLE